MFVGEFLILCSALDKDGYEIGETFQRAGSLVPPGVRAGALRCPTRYLVPSSMDSENKSGKHSPFVSIPIGNNVER